MQGQQKSGSTLAAVLGGLAAVGTVAVAAFAAKRPSGQRAPRPGATAGAGPRLRKPCACGR